MQFSDLKIIEPILKALENEGYTNPTPIQEQAITPILEGKDLLGCAQTGTGKTAAFAIPILQQLYLDFQKNERSNTIKTLILTPTRELAIQIDESLESYGKQTKLRHFVIFGGVGQKQQTDALRKGVDILVATPGRLLDLMNQGFISLNHIKIFVLDEADRMLDMGFIHDVKKVIAKIPAKRQTLFFSATMPPEIQKLADTILKNPVKVEVTPVSSTADTIEQSIYFVQKNDKKNLIIHLLDDKDIKSALVFTRTKHGADKVVKDLLKANIKAEAIHGNKSQNARQRALSNFKDGTTRVLLATDIASRGIDVDNLTHVINYELPNIPETYVHRIGRTGRAGNSGIAFSFCDDEEKPYLKDIQKLIGKVVPVAENNPYPHTGLSEMPSGKPKTEQRGGGNGPRPNRNAEQQPKPNSGSNNRWYRK
jgi:ATP-dependent RNA helicase RhlE